MRAIRSLRSILSKILSLTVKRFLPKKDNEVTIDSSEPKVDTISTKETSENICINTLKKLTNGTPIIFRCNDVTVAIASNYAVTQEVGKSLNIFAVFERKGESWIRIAPRDIYGDEMSVILLSIALEITPSKKDRDNALNFLYKKYLEMIMSS